MVGDKKVPHEIMLFLYYPVLSSITNFFAHMLKPMILWCVYGGIAKAIDRRDKVSIPSSNWATGQA